MSGILASKRIVSKAEYVNTANQIYIETISFLTRLSARYSRLLAEPIAKLAGEVVDETEKANNIFPANHRQVEMRKVHLLEARASLRALEVRLTHCYLIMALNPEGCFTTSKGKAVDSQRATEKLDKMSDNLSKLINEEERLINEILTSDQKRVGQ